MVGPPVGCVKLRAGTPKSWPSQTGCQSPPSPSFSPLPDVFAPTGPRQHVDWKVTLPIIPYGAHPSSLWSDDTLEPSAREVRPALRDAAPTRSVERHN